MMDPTLLSDAGWIDAAGVMLALVGMIMIIMEIFLPALGLFGLTGIAAITIGTVVLHQSGFLQHMNIGIGTIIGIISGLVVLALLTGWVTWQAYRRKISTGPESLLGADAEVIEWNGRSGRVRVQGEIWQAESERPLPAQAGDHVLISRVEDLHLKVTSHQS